MEKKCLNFVTNQMATFVMSVNNATVTVIKVSLLHLFQSGISFAEVLCKNRYVGRSFIQPSTRLRQLAVAKKFGKNFLL